MKPFTVFIGYSSNDKDYANYINQCLSRINQINPYLAEYRLDLGEDSKERILAVLEQSYFMVILLTESGAHSQWVNQELGYALAIRRRNKGNPFFIPITQKSVELKGLITKGSTDMLFIDDYTPEWIVGNIIYKMRNKIPQGWTNGTLTTRIACSNCKDKRNLPLEVPALLPDYETKRRAFEIKQFTCSLICPNCGVKLGYDMRTCLPIDLSTIVF